MCPSIAGAGLRTFFRIADAWKLTPEEQVMIVGCSSLPTLCDWRERPDSAPLEPEALERLSCIFGIFRGLQILLPDEPAADAWIKKPNSAPLFRGRSALEVILQGNLDDLRMVRRYIDDQQ
jgi:hypothetical protein